MCSYIFNSIRNSVQRAMLFHVISYELILTKRTKLGHGSGEEAVDRVALRKDVWICTFRDMGVKVGGRNRWLDL